MNSVDRVKKYCKSKKIAISTLERELGYSNGYVGKLKKGVFPGDRLREIANYLGVTVDYLIGASEEPNGKNPMLAWTEEPLLKPETIDYLANKKSTTPEGMVLTETQSAAINLVMQLADAQLNKFIKLAELLLEESAK